MHQHGEVTAIIKDHVGRPTIRTLNRLLNTPPEFFFGLAFPSKDGDISRGNGGSRLVLGGKDVARRPAHRGTKGDECFDQHRCLDGHMKATCNAGTGKWL